jgi:hypothetical protein
MIKRHIIKEGPEKSGPKVGIGPALMAFSILLSAFVFAPDVVRSQTITFAGDADQGDQGRFFSRIVQNNTVKGKLVAIPFFTDAGFQIGDGTRGRSIGSGRDRSCGRASRSKPI